MAGLGAKSLRLAGGSMIASAKVHPEGADIDYGAAVSKVVRRPSMLKKTSSVPVGRVTSPPTTEPHAPGSISDRMGMNKLMIHRFGAVEPTHVTCPKPALTRVNTIEGKADLNSPQRNNCSEACFSLAFSPDGSHLAGCFFDGTLTIFDGFSGVQQDSKSLPAVEGFVDSKSPSVTCVQWFPDSPGNPMLATTDAAGAICLWQVSARKSTPLENILQMPGGPLLSSVAIGCDGSRIAVGGAEHVVRVYDIHDGISTEVRDTGRSLGGAASIPGRISGHTLKIACLRADRVNPNLFISGGIDRKILRWDLRVGSDAVAAIHGPVLTGSAIDISSDGNTMLTGSHRAQDPIQLFDLRRVSKAYSTLSEACGTYQWSGDEPGDAKRTVSMLLGAAWNANTNKIIVAAGQHENKAKVFALRSDAKQMHTIGSVENGMAGGFWSVAAAPDGSRAAFGGQDGTVHLAHVPLSHQTTSNDSQPAWQDSDSKLEV